MAGSKLSLALVGCGKIARAHWRGIRYVADRIDVTAVVDTNAAHAAQFAERTGAQAFTSLEDALAHGHFDAVDIMLPHDLHEWAATVCFAAGKHVCLEKPLAADIASAERILELAAAAETCFMVAEQAQYWPDVHKAKELMDAGAIGEITTARGCFYDTEEVDPGAPPPWRFSVAKSGGGISMDGGAHWIRPLRILLGEIEEVVAVTAQPIARMEGESMAHAIFRFKSGVTATFDALLTGGARAPSEDFRVTGTAGELVIENGREGRLKLYDEEHPNGIVIMDSFPGKLDSYGIELQEFADLVLDGKQLAASPECSLGELRTAFAIYRSAESGGWEKVWED
jgi:predicted dehydrogenase